MTCSPVPGSDAEHRSTAGADPRCRRRRRNRSPTRGEAPIRMPGGASFGGDDEVPAPVLLPAVLVVLRAERPVLPVGDRSDSAGFDSQRTQVFLHGRRAAVAEREVVLLRPAIVA